MVDLIFYTSTYILILPMVIGGVRFRLLGPGQRWLWIMIILVALNQFISRWWTYAVTENNLPFFYVYILIELVFLTRVYSFHLPPFRSTRILLILAGVYSLAWIIQFARPGIMWQYPDALRTLESLLILFYAGSYFMKVFREEKILDLEREFGFWLSAGYTVYFASNLLLFAFSELVVKQESSIYKSIWVVHAVLTIFLYISLTIALWCRKKVTLS